MVFFGTLQGSAQGTAQGNFQGTLQGNAQGQFQGYGEGNFNYAQHSSLADSATSSGGATVRAAYNSNYGWNPGQGTSMTQFNHGAGGGGNNEVYVYYNTILGGDYGQSSIAIINDGPSGNWQQQYTYQYFAQGGGYGYGVYGMHGYGAATNQVTNIAVLF